MARYIVEVSQPWNTLSARSIRHAAEDAGSHFVARAAWRHVGRMCVGTLALDAESKAEALGVVPPGMRAYAEALEMKSALAA